MASGDFKDLTRRTTSYKILHKKAFNISKNPKYDGYQRDLASTVYKSFDKKATSGAIKNEIISNKELAEELHKPITRKFVDSPTPKSTLTFCRQYLRRRSSKYVIDD